MSLPASRFSARGENGFTLVEALVAIALLATLGAIVFGSLLTLRLFADMPPSGYLFAALALLAARPAALAIALAGGGLSWREWVAAAWFGPKGFSSEIGRAHV